MDTMIGMYASLNSFIDKLEDVKSEQSNQQEKLIDNDKIVVADFKVVE